MPRIKIEPADKFFNITIKIPVRITDINYGNHVGNDSLVSIVHEARVQFLNQHGYTELNIEGVGLILSNLVVEFINESFYQDIVEVKMGTVDISGVSFELFYQLSTVRNNKEFIIANAKTTMVCYNYLLKKVVSIPPILKDILC